MKQKLTLRRVLASAVAALAAAAAVWLLCRWVGYDLQLRIGNEPVYEIANDDYTQIIDVPEDGLWQAVPLEAGQTLYGCRLRFSTHGELYRAGMVMVDLCDADGTILREAAGNYANIFDDNFTGFAFGTAYTAAQAETLHLHIYNVVEWEGPLGLWASTGTVGALALTADGVDADATLALQYMTDDTGSWPSDLANGLAPLLAFAAFAAVLLFGLRAPLPLTVAVVGLACGLLFVRVTPALVAPDEYTHLAKCYRQSSTLLGQPVADDDDMLLVRSCDAPYFKNHTGDIGIYAYKEMLEHLGDAGCSGETTVSSDTYVTADPINNTLYLGQIAGITLARMMGLGFHGMLLLGRLCNLALYLALAAAAVNIAPQRLRGIFAGVALLAQPLQLAGSLSADAAVLGYLFCFTALCLTLRTRPARWPETVAAVVLAALIGPAKAIYLPAVLLIFMIPDANLALPGKRWPVGPIAKVLALVLAAIGWVQVNMGAALYAARDVDTVGILRAGGAAAAGAALLALLYWKIRRDPKKKKIFLGAIAAVVVLAIPVGLYKLTHMWGGLTPEQLVGSIQENGDSIYTYSAGYICRNLPNTAKLLLRSFSAQGAQWVQGVLGTALGEPIVYTVDASWVLGVGFILALLAAALPQAGETVPLGRRTKAGVWGIVLCVIALSFVTALNWTPINYTTIFGLQGRYWLPVLPLVLALVHHNRTFAVQKPAERKAVFAMLCLTSFVILQGAGLYATFQMPS